MPFLEGIFAQGPGLSAGSLGANIATVLLSITTILYILYRRIMPKPLPGIPYHPEALNSPLGDMPALLKAAKERGDTTAWMQDQIKEFNSPISQMFIIFPYWKPVVMLSDAREVEDILVRRTPKEFDRSTSLASLFEGIVPDHQIMLPTDANWKARRRLLQDLMTPSFLRGTASPAIYKTVVNLVELWEVKKGLVGGHREFSARDDVHLAALDGVMMFSFGEDPEIGEGPISGKLRYLKTLGEEDRMKIADREDGPVEIPEGELDETTKWILELGDSVEQVRKVLFRRLAWRYWRRTKLRRSLELKKRFILGQLDKAVKEMEKHNEDDESWIRSAVDHIVMRERKYAAKEGRKPDYASHMILEETFGFILAGHETTSTSVMWSLKILADNQDEQTKLRQVLQKTFPEALAERRLLTNEELHDTNIPYVDAALEELLRCAPTLTVNSRTAIKDTIILGHHIPKGTLVFLTGANMHGTHIPPFPIDESIRSESSRTAKAQGRCSGVWNEDDMGEFKPSRWLKDDGHGNQVFDSMAGPHLGFGLGIRGCYGRRLAYIEFRSLIVLIIWRFVLDKCGKEESGYEAIDGITRRPKKCFVKLRDAH
ncbi:Cytochrome P450 [Rhypophila decipiens]